MSEVEKKIAAVRPSLRQVAPLTAALCWGYVVVNIVLGVGMYLLYLDNPAVPIAVADILDYRVWGLLFAAIGIVGGYALAINNWKMIRQMQFAGLFLKAVWAIALIIRSLAAPQTLLITAVWLFFAYVQAMVYIYFIPGTPKNVE